MTGSSASTSYDYFVAARYRNKANAMALTCALREGGHRVYCFVDSRASIERVDALSDDPEEAMRQLEAHPHDHPAIIDVFQTDLKAERNSTNFVLLLPAGMSCHVEAGIAYGLGKHLVLIGQPEKTETLYQIFHERYQDQEDFLHHLKESVDLKHETVSEAV